MLAATVAACGCRAVTIQESRLASATVGTAAVAAEEVAQLQQVQTKQHGQCRTDAATVHPQGTEHGDFATFANPAYGQAPVFVRTRARVHQFARHFIDDVERRK